MFKKITQFFLVWFLIFPSFSYAENDYQYGKVVMPDVVRKFNDEQIKVFKEIITPYLLNFFKEKGKFETDDNFTIYQELQGIRLTRVDTTEDEITYLVHLEFIGLTFDNSSGDYFGGLKGQDIVFLIKDNAVHDFRDLSIYYLETPKSGVFNIKKIEL